MNTCSSIPLSFDQLVNSAPSCSGATASASGSKKLHRSGGVVGLKEPRIFSNFFLPCSGRKSFGRVPFIAKLKSINSLDLKPESTRTAQSSVRTSSLCFVSQLSTTSKEWTASEQMAMLAPTGLTRELTRKYERKVFRNS